MIFTRAIVLAALLAGPAAASGQESEEPRIAPPVCDYGAPHPDAPQEIRQFDFLIGDYAIGVSRWTGEGWQAVPASAYGPARWNGRWILGGMAIEDEWFDKDPGLDPDSVRGVNVRMWDAEAGEWDMMWVYTGNHQVQDLRAKEIDGVLTMWQVYPERPDFRATFERTGPDSWARITLKPGDEGEWVPTIRLEATRIPCAED